MKKILLFLAFLLNCSLTYADNLSIITPSPDDSYTINARILAKYLTKHLPNHPDVIIQPMPGAQSLVAANWLYNIAPRDGSVIATLQKEIPFDGLLGGKGVQFDQTKFTWLGSTSDGRKDAVMLWANEPNFRDDFIVGAESPTAGNMAVFLNKVMGTKFKIVTGYQTTGANRLAFERKETDAVIYSLAGIKTQKPDWLNPDSLIKPFLQFGNGKNRLPEYSDIPTLEEKVDSNYYLLIEAFETQFILLRPFLAPPNLPADKITELRRGLEAAAYDSEYIAEAKKARIDVNFIEGERAEMIVDFQSRTDPKIINQLKEIYHD